MDSKSKFIALIATVAVLGAAGVVSGFTPMPLSAVIGTIKVHVLGEVTTPLNSAQSARLDTADQIAASKKKFDDIRQTLGKERAQQVDILRATDVNPEDVKYMRQSGKVNARVNIDPNLENVSLCGDTYVARALTIDGVDVVKRVAILLAKDTTPVPSLDNKPYATVVCSNMNMPSRNMYGNFRVAEVAVTDVTSESWDKEGKIAAYYFGIGDVRFVVNSSTNDIYAQGGFDGTLHLIGNLLK